MSFSDWKNTRKKLEPGIEKSPVPNTVDQVNSGTVKPNFSDWRREKTKGDRQAAVASWVEKYNSTMKGIADYGTQLKDGYTTDISGGYSGAVNELLNEYEGIQDSAAEFGLADGEKYYKHLQDLQGNIRSANAWYAGFAPTEEQAAEGYTAEKLYTEWSKDNNYRQKYQGKSYSEIVEAIDALQNGEEKQWLKNNANSFRTIDDIKKQLENEIAVLAKLEPYVASEQALNEYLLAGDQSDTASRLGRALLDVRAKYGISDDESIADAVDRKNAEIDELDALIQEYPTMVLKTIPLEELAAKVDQARADMEDKQKLAIGSESTYGQMLNSGSGITNNFDQEQAEEDAYNAQLESLLMEAQTARNDFESALSYYEKISDIYTYRSHMERINSMTKLEKLAFEGYLVLRDEYGIREWESKLTDGQKKIIGSPLLYLEQHGYTADELKKLAETYGRFLNEEKTQKTTENARKFADDFHILPTVSAFPAKLLGAITGTASAVDLYVKDLFDQTSYHTLDPNAAGYQPQIFADTVRQAESEGMDIATRVVYNAFNSTGDNLLRVAVGGPKGALILAGMDSFSSTVRKVSQNGGMPEEAIMLGLAKAGLEVLTEKVSIDSFIKLDKPSDAIDLLNNLRKQGLIEVSEEELSFLGGIAAEAVILGNKSDISLRLAELERQGKNNEKAKKIVFEELFMEAAETAITSYLSGSMMGGVSAITQKNSDSKQETAVEAKPGTVEYVQELSALGADKQGVTAPQSAQRAASSPDKGSLGAQGAFENFESILARGTNAAADPVGAALDGFKQTGTVTNKQATDILNNSKALQTLREQVGLELPDTASGRRNAIKAAVEQLAQQQSETIDKSGVTDGFTGMSGLSYNAEQASLLASLSTTAIQNATDLYGKKDITFNDIGISDAETRQAWIDAGLAYEETSPDGTKYVAIQSEMLMDERARRREAQRQTTVDTESHAEYDNENNQGGTLNADTQGRSVHSGGDGRNTQSNSQRETSRSAENGGRNVQSSHEVRLYGGDGQGTLYASDSEGRELTPDQTAKLQGTAVTDSNGAPLAVYHVTDNTEFTTFAKGDTGFHFGSAEQAARHAKKRGYTTGRTFRVYLNIKNPIRTSKDIMGWHPGGTALLLWSDGILTESEMQEVTAMYRIGDGYDSAAAIRLREILESKGYDGIAYPNAYEGEGHSYMAFHDDQIIRSEETYFGPSGDSGNGPSVSNQATTTSTTSVGAAPAGFDENTVGSAQSRFDRKQNTSKVYSNTYANATGEAVRNVGEESKAADPNIDKYDVVTEDESTYNAELRTRNESEINFEYEDLLSKTGWTGEDNDTAQRVLDYLRKSGDTKRLTALARKRTQEGTRSGQLVQSFAKYTRMNATDCVLEVVESIDNLTPAEVSSRHYKKQGFDQWKQSVIKTSVDIANQIDAVEDGNVESMKDIIRSLAKFRKTTAWFGMSSDLTKIAEGALKDIDFDTAKAIANAQLSTLPRDFQKRSVGQVVKTVRIHNMLSALTTVNRNLAGNASIGIIDAVSDSTVGRCLDSLVSLATKKRTVGNDVTHAKTYFEGASKATKLAALCTELDIPLDSESRFSTGMTRTYSPQGGPVTRFLSAFEKSMRYALEVTDQFFDGGTNAVVEKSLADLGSKSNLTTDEAAKIAELVGKRRTFKDDRAMARAAKGVKQGLNELGTGNIGVGDMVLPFAGTGSNVGQAAIDYNSLGIGGFIDIFRLMYDVKKGKYENGVKKVTKNGKVVREVSLVEAQRQAVSNAARGLTGAGLIAAFTALAATGILGVHDDEDKDKRGLEQSMNLSGAQLNVDAAMRWVRGESTDWQDGDWCLSIDFLEPFNAQMYVGYLLSQEDSIQDMAKSYPQNAVAGVYQSVMDMPMMQGLSDFSDLVTNVGSTLSEGGEWQDTMAEAGGQLLGNTASGFIPSWVRQTAQIIDPYYRDTTGSTAGERAINQILAMIPVASKTLPKKYSGLGQEQRRYEDLVSGILNTMVNPGELEQIKSSEVADYLDELSERTGDVTFYPAYIAPGSFTMDGEKVAINGKENTEDYQKTYGTNVNRLYGQLIKNADFLDASDELQVKILNSAKDYAVMLAKAEVSDYAEVPSYIKNRASGMSEAEAILRHALLVDSDGDAVSKSTEKYSYLSIDDACDVVSMLTGLTPEGGKTKVRDIQKIEAITGADSKLSAEEQTKVLEDTLDDKAFAKYQQVLKLGMDNDDYATSYRIYLDEKAVGGKGTKARIIAEFQDDLGVSKSVAEALYDIYG